MIDSGHWVSKKILLIDRDVKNKNDRTWCFWEKEIGYFEHIVLKKWQTLQLISHETNIPLDIQPYSYKMIRGIDFYNYCFDKIRDNPNITVLNGNISFDAVNNYSPSIDGAPIDMTSSMVFNSINLPQIEDKGQYNLKQHFKGWIIETQEAFFDPETATLMDFRVDQSAGTTFVYVLPLTSTTALIEYTLFNEKVMTSEEYDIELRKYISDFLKCNSYKVIEEELGVIPMTSARFHSYKTGMINIGTAGGQTKASTGYTFRFIQKHSEQIVSRMINGQSPIVNAQGTMRFKFYDNTLLHILSGKKLSGKQIFEMLFRKNKASKIFKFLDNETSVIDELKIIITLPTKQFLEAGMKEFWKLLF